MASWFIHGTFHIRPFFAQQQAVADVGVGAGAIAIVGAGAGAFLFIGCLGPLFTIHLFDD